MDKDGALTSNAAAVGLTHRFEIPEIKKQNPRTWLQSVFFFNSEAVFELTFGGFLCLLALLTRHVLLYEKKKFFSLCGFSFLLAHVSPEWQVFWKSLKDEGEGNRTEAHKLPLKPVLLPNDSLGPRRDFLFFISSSPHLAVFLPSCLELF